MKYYLVEFAVTTEAVYESEDAYIFGPFTTRNKAERLSEKMFRESVLEDIAWDNMTTVEDARKGFYKDIFEFNEPVLITWGNWR